MIPFLARLASYFPTVPLLIQREFGKTRGAGLNRLM